ncbi:MAG: lysylphosphatidylglycerol synthase transmembrane domain-containing protein [Aggregatilineales bacterium]
MKSNHVLYIRNTLAGLLVTVFFLWLALRGVSFDLIDTTLNSIRWVYLILPLMIWGVGLIARAMRWRLLLNNKLTPRDSLSVIGIVYMLNATIPFRAGELARLYLVARSGKEISGWTVLTTVLTETILDMLSIVLLLTMIIPFLAISKATIVTGLLIGLVFAVGFIVLLIFARRPQIAHSILDGINRIFPPLGRLPLRSLLDKLLQGIMPLAKWRTLILALLWTSLIWGSTVLAIWSASLAIPQFSFSGDLPAGLVLVLVSTSLGAIVPFTMAGVGPFEAGVVFGLGVVGISQEVAVTFGIILHVLMILHFILWGMIGILTLRLSLIDIRGLTTYIRLKLFPPETKTTPMDIKSQEI